MTHSHFWILGGDLRQHWLARKLAQDGHFVHCFALDSQFLPQQDNIILEHNFLRCQKEDPVIFPLPMVQGDGNLTAPFYSQTISIETILDQLQEQEFMVGGQVNPFVQALCTKRNLTMEDYFTQEEFTIANAVPTAEGCLQIAMERLPITLQDAKILVLGYGTVAKATAKRFLALGANVTVSARRTAPLSQAKADGFIPLPLHELPQSSEDFACVVNTIPSQVLGEAQLTALPPNTLIIDLASRPGGVDTQSAEQLQRTVVHALSLPGKVAPATAGTIIKETLYLLLEKHSERTAIL